MDLKNEFHQYIVKKVADNSRLLKRTSSLIPIAVSARHCHLKLADIKKLFGEKENLTVKNYLSQPNQYASEEKVTIVGPKHKIENVRVLGPARNFTQVEISKTDSIKLGLNPPVRQSGDIKGSSPITIIGPKGKISLQEGLIIAHSHIHMSPQDAKHFNVNNNEIVRVKAISNRQITFESVVIRVSPKYVLEMHIDTDEGNASLVDGDQYGKIIKYNKDDALC